MVSPLQSVSLEFVIPKEAQPWPVQDMLGGRMEKKSLHHYACISVGKQRSFLCSRGHRHLFSSTVSCHGALARSLWPKAKT